LCRTAGIPLVPTFVTFTPWTTRQAYVDLLDEIDRLDLTEHVAPIQLAIRLLITQGSPLLELPEIRAVAGPFNPHTLTHPWRHQDPEVDRLQHDIETLVGGSVTAERRRVFNAVYRLAAMPNAEGRMPNAETVRSRAAVPYLTEPWYC
jgi:hypothetical protein